MTINSSPELLGDSAREFIEAADKEGKTPLSPLSREREAEISKFLSRSRNYILPQKK